MTCDFFYLSEEFQVRGNFIVIVKFFKKCTEGKIIEIFHRSDQGGSNFSLNENFLKFQYGGKHNLKKSHVFFIK